uniref:CARD domain-containing protein n=1 Tax=Paramormyrops kingsleyae TaxID=1676925 RepID=A0A3B3SBX3_9TELE
CRESPGRKNVAFVDQHREAIVQRVSLIEPILDELHKQISEEKYDYICAAKTRRNKFRRLYEVLNCKKLKMLFFEAVKRKEPHLISELESYSKLQIIHSESKCC